MLCVSLDLFPHVRELRHRDDLWGMIVHPAGTFVFGVDTSVLPNGSGDTTFDYVRVFCMAVVAIAVTLIWSLLDRRREEYSRLDAWLRMYIRFSLAMTMVIYGVVNVVPSQFPQPTLAKLSMTFGDQSPMGLLWSFMGASKAYTMFGGSSISVRQMNDVRTRFLSEIAVAKKHITLRQQQPRRRRRWC